MKKIFRVLLVLLPVLVLTLPAHATNGDHLIGVGPVSRAMGGVGIAQPRDAISAVFSNPASMCFGDFCPASEFNFSGTLFMPKTEAKVTNVFSGEVQADAEENVYAIPAIGVSVPMGQGEKNWRFGIAAYGVSGLGVDYKDTAIDNSTFYDFGPMGQFPMVSGEYTSLQIMKFAPAVAFQPLPNLSVGLAVHIDYGNLDLRDGSSTGYALGVQPGLIYNITDTLSFGLTYTSPQKIDHDNVRDFDGDGDRDTLTLESPNQFGAGLAYRLMDWNALFEANIKWLNWSDAEGYSDFDWEDQWIFAVGAEFEPIDDLFLRVGYNYGKSPVNEHKNFNGMSMTTVQGKTMPTYYYETFRVIGFPAVVEHHLTMGVGYEFTDKLSFHLGYMHAFKETIEESGTDITGQPVKLESSLSENAIDFGFTWRF
jgi:long-chain fatty acid transport protein